MGNATVADSPVVNDDIRKTQEVLDTMDEETKEKIRRTLNDFFARRLNKKETEVVEEEQQQQQGNNDDDEEEESNVQSVVVDIIVDDDDEDLSEGTESKSDDSDISEGSVNNEWQMVTEDDEMIAIAAQMLGSALFQSDASIDRSA